MKSYQTFIFDSYTFDDDGRGTTRRAPTIELRYSLDDEVKFVETLVLPRPPSQPLPPAVAGERGDAVTEALFALHLICGISYYKTCCPKKIEIRSGSLTKEQAEFWNSVYENGLGEFFFRNKIDFHGLINFPEIKNQKSKNNPITKNEKRKTNKRILVPLGGGKDSIVTAEILKAAGYDCTLFRLGHHPYIDYIAHRAKFPLLTVERSLPKELFELNEQGALNGHVPFSAMLAFLTILISLLYDFDAVVLSNERSANEGNIEFLGKEINHQWSKSLEFERMFQQYIAECITPDVRYFSLLQPLSELAITKRFAELPEYFEITTSCNANWRLMKKCLVEEGKLCPENGLWCGACPKCAFVFCLFTAFLPRTTLEKMFRKNLFDDSALLPLYRELLGLEGFKPFECVGTPDETKAAFLLAAKRGEFEDTAVMKMFLSESLPSIKDSKKLIESVLEPNGEHALPEEFSRLILQL